MGWLKLASGLATLLNGLLRHLGRKRLMEAGEDKIARGMLQLVVSRIAEAQRHRRDPAARERVLVRLFGDRK
jgi:hypothetical protein